MVTAQQEQTRVFLMGGGVQTLERTVELFCGKSLEFSVVAKCNMFR